MTTMAAQEVLLRSPQRAGTWVLRWDDAVAHLFDPAGGEVFTPSPTLTFGMCFDRYDLLVRHRVSFRLPSGRFGSDADEAATRSFARVLYPVLVLAEDQDRGHDAVPIVRRHRAVRRSVMLAAVVAPISLANPTWRAHLGLGWGAVVAATGALGCAVAVRAGRRAYRRRAVSRAVATLAPEGWSTALPDGFGDLICPCPAPAPAES